MKTIILKRLFKTNKGITQNHVLTSKYIPSNKYVLFMKSKYFINTWHYDYKTYRTKKDAMKWEIEFLKEN